MSCAYFEAGDVRIGTGLAGYNVARGLRRLDADNLAIIGHAVLELRLRRIKLRARLRQRRLSLRDVGARHFADIETILRLAELLFQNFDIRFTQFHNRAVANHIHILRRSRQQNLLQP